MSLLQFIGDPIITDPLGGLLSVIFAFFVGIISSALGVGGGFITTPSLIILGIGEVFAIGTVLFMIIFTALSSTIAYSRQKGLTEYRTGLLIA
ncbi:MAG: TSUP family transporter, partial [Candidatus Hodarchaeales archaeon]